MNVQHNRCTVSGEEWSQQQTKNVLSDLSTLPVLEQPEAQWKE